ncbi:MAG: hypothetical protein JSW00_12955 [Thermoplasmata archaeon]|nr:MAG: hypothetical protein JSW00_12955 [Thermoplasmata archaeon]
MSFTKNSKKVPRNGNSKDWIKCSSCGAKVKRKNLARHKVKMHPALYQTPKGKAAIIASFIAFVVVVAALLSYYQPWPQNQDNEKGTEEDQMIVNEDFDNTNDEGIKLHKRTVLIETFTSVDCYWCNAEEEPALKRIAQDYNRNEVIILAYHGFFGNDPWETEEGNQRAEYYGGVTGTPNVWFDGVLNKVGGTGQGVDAMYNVYTDYIDQRVPIDTYVFLEIQGEISGPRAQISVWVNYTGEGDPSNLFVRFALVEDGLFHEGKTYDWVMRDYSEMSLSGKTFPIYIQESFELESSWDRDNLRGIVWVQDDTDREVSQAIYLDFNG